MNDTASVAIIVPDREVRDLICLNLRFESVNTLPFESVEEFLQSETDAALAVLDITGRDDGLKYAKSLREKPGDSFPVILLREEISDDNSNDILIETQNGRIRFDASALVSKVKKLIESNRDEPSKHPLTGLPAGSVVEKHIVGLLASGKNFSLIASDMDNMKAFNQRFGYQVGDSLLKNFVNLMENVLRKHTSELNFLGHRGEDDFVIIADSDSALKIAAMIVDGFDIMVTEYFSDEDNDKEYFIVNDRRGNKLKFPLTTVSLVVVNTEGRYFSHPAELYDVAEELMSEVKARGIHQSYCVVDKRAGKSKSHDVFI